MVGPASKGAGRQLTMGVRSRGYSLARMTWQCAGGAGGVPIVLWALVEEAGDAFLTCRAQDGLSDQGGDWQHPDVGRGFDGFCR